MKRKEDILQATACLAAKRGLGNVSLSQIASAVGLSKPALYNHFSSKDELIVALYEYLRAQAKETNLINNVDYGDFVKGREPLAILQEAVSTYEHMSSHSGLGDFYRVIVSEQVFSKDAADIMCRETERMIQASKSLFYAMEVHQILHFNDIDEEAFAFAMTIHSIMDYKHSLQLSGNDKGEDHLLSYLTFFCKNHQIK